MATSLSFNPNLVLYPFPHRTLTRNPLFHRTHFGHKPFLRGSLSVAKFGFRSDPESAEAVIRELFGKAESLLFTIADAAVSSSETVATTKQNSDWLSGITNAMETVLKVLKDGLSTLHVPYSYGFAIILLTVLVKAATFPLTKKQVESAMAMRSLTPQIKAIQQRYAGDQERIQLETARLYKLAGINPLAGCLPTLATIPVWIGLYRALSNVADEDGHPPLGWSDTFAYLVLPVLLVVSQYISVQIMQSAQSNDPNMKSSQAITKVLPLVIGYFSLSVPSGLSLYWFTNNILSTAQQVWLQKFGGAKNPMKEFTEVVKEEPLEIKKSVSELTLPRKEAKREEKLTPEGLRPGERFKQLKEQEAKRRHEREEKRKAEGDQVLNEDVIDEKNGNTPSPTGRDKLNVGISMNGDSSTQEVKEDNDAISVFKMENKKVSTESKVDGRDEQQLHETSEKESVEAHTISSTNDKKHSEEETHHVRRE